MTAIEVSVRPRWIWLREVCGRFPVLAQRHPLSWGVFFLISATSLWALAFAAPLALDGASAVEITLGRFIVYGLISLAFVTPAQLLALPAGILGRAVVYALTGNVFYYGLLVLGIQLADATLAVLVIGMLPVSIALWGSVGQGGHRDFGELAWPLAVFALGIAIFNIAKTDFLQDLSGVSWAGVACLVTCLMAWTWYAVHNARFLKSRPAISATMWSSMVGVVSLSIALIALPAAWALGLARDPRTLDGAALGDLALWSVVFGGGATWLGTILFNQASKLLNTSLLGQLIVFEAIFGSLYVFFFSRSLPGGFEALGILIALSAVWWSMRRLNRT